MAQFPINAKTHLGLFAKHWIPGQVKTRLAATIGKEFASQVYFEFLTHLLTNLRHCAHQRSVVYAPAAAREAFASVSDHHWSLEPQSQGDLGNRLDVFFRDKFRAEPLGRSSAPVKAVVIGSDCPLLAADDIQSAFLALDDHDVVLGPSRDGGYYLLGMRGQPFALFDNIAWSSPYVCEQTIRCAGRLGISCVLLREMNDIDDVQDLIGLGHHLRAAQKLNADNQHEEHSLDLWTRLQFVWPSLLTI